MHVNGTTAGRRVVSWMTCSTVKNITQGNKNITAAEGRSRGCLLTSPSRNDLSLLSPAVRRGAVSLSPIQSFFVGRGWNIDSRAIFSLKRLSCEEALCGCTYFVIDGYSLVCARMCTYPYYNRFASHDAVLDTWVCAGVLLVASVFTPAVI